MNKLIILLTVIFGVIVGYRYLAPKNGQIITTTKEKVTQKVAAVTSSGIVADKLEVPWGMVFLPDKSILFTERPGRVRFISADGKLTIDPVLILNDVKRIGEGGLLGIEIHPNFAKNHYVYLYYTYSGDANLTLNKVVRYKYESARLSDPKILISDIPGNSNHNGGRLKFGPDGFLYITTGDSQNPSLSQDKNSLAGKILRVTDDGKAAPGNPFGNLTYSYGHRNPQGLAWDESGNLWETEHGSSAGDEINLIKKGHNYGWPDIRKNETKAGMDLPVLHSNNDTWAPSGLVYIKPFLYFAGLRGSALFRYGTQTTNFSTYLRGKYGRLRDVVFGPDGMLYLTTSNMDGRAITHLDGDKIIRLDPNKL